VSDGLPSRASPLSAGHVLQNRIVEHRFGQELLQLGVLDLKSLQTLGIGYVHAAKLRLVIVEAGRADAVLAANLRRRHARLVLLQDGDDLPF
jgi:hypothetical protein